MDIWNNVPDFINKTFETYFSGEGCEERLYTGVSKDECDSFVEELINSGYEKIFSHSIEENDFCTLIKDKTVLQTGFIPSDCAFRITIDSKTALPQFVMSDKLNRTAKTTLWQFEVDHKLIDCGMCYIIRACDGSFFIIDSAHTYSVNDCERIHDFLRKRTPENEKIRIAGWFLSHGHVDHIAQFMNFLSYYSDDAVIEKLYFNFIKNDHRDNGDWMISDLKHVEMLYALLEKHPEIPVCRLHTGESFYVANLKFDVLCSHEDVFPNDNSNYNDSSVVLMMTAENTKVLFPGDAGGEESKVLEARYPNYINSDIVQAAHHAHFGTSVHFYELVDAEVALVPTTQIKYDEEYERIEADRKMAAIAKYLYIASNGTVEIDLPYASGEIKVYPDETFESFSGVYNLWGYEYTSERKAELYNAYLERGGKPLDEYKEGF